MPEESAPESEPERVTVKQAPVASTVTAKPVPVSAPEPVEAEAVTNPIAVQPAVNEWDDLDGEFGAAVEAAVEAPVVEEVADWDTVPVAIESNRVVVPVAVTEEPAEAPEATVVYATDDWATVTDDDRLISGVAFEEDSEPEPLVVPPGVRYTDANEQPVHNVGRTSNPRSRHAYRITLTPADRALLRALARLRWASTEHLQMYLTYCGDDRLFTNLSHEALRDRLARLARSDRKADPYILGRKISDAYGNERKVYTCTATGIEVGAPLAAGWLDPYRLNENVGETSTAHVAIASAYLCQLDARQWLAVPDAVITRGLGIANQEAKETRSVFRPVWDASMNPYGADSANLGILGSDDYGLAHEPDLAVLEIERMPDGDERYRYSMAVEVEVTAKAPNRLRDVLAKYRDSGVHVHYLVHNTAIPGGGLQGVNSIANGLRRAAASVWQVPADRVDDIDGFSLDVMPEAWKGALPFSMQEG
jgi:hypothetical protein